VLKHESNLLFLWGMLLKNEETIMKRERAAYFGNAWGRMNAVIQEED
jgi:hypothetical protein